MDVSKVGVTLNTTTNEGSPPKENPHHHKSMSGAGVATNSSLIHNQSTARRHYCDCPKRVYYDRFVDLPDGRTYKGEWLATASDIKDGIGVMFWQDGTKYEGTFHAD